MEKIAVALSNLVITVSPSVEIIAQNEHHYFKNKITHVLSGVSVIGNSKNEPLNYKKRNKEITITLISRLRPDKGHIEAFQAVKLLKAQFPSLRLLIAGSGPEKINFEHLIQKEKLEKEVIFLGKVDNVKDLFDTTDIVIIPSYYDACPKTAIEALECGKAIIASYTEGLKDLIISNETGIHIQPKNHLELANAIDLLINNKDLRKKLEQNAKKDYFNRLTPEIMANEYYLKYKDLIQD
jgi:glycosyltransferase involved in cell wall biosynthesis